MVAIKSGQQNISKDANPATAMATFEIIFWLRIEHQLLQCDETIGFEYLS